MQSNVLASPTSFEIENEYLNLKSSDSVRTKYFISPFCKEFTGNFVTRSTNPPSGRLPFNKVTHSLYESYKADVAQDPLSSPEFNSPPTVTSADNSQDPDAAYTGKQAGYFASSSAAVVNKAVLGQISEPMATETTSCQTENRNSAAARHVSADGDGVLAKELEHNAARAWDPTSVYVAPGAPPPTPELTSQGVADELMHHELGESCEPLPKSLVEIHSSEQSHELVPAVLNEDDIATPPSSPSSSALAAQPNDDNRKASEVDPDSDGDPNKASPTLVLGTRSENTLGLIASHSVFPPTPPATPKKGTALSLRGFTIRGSTTGGLGAFATSRLRRGDVILEEFPLFIASRDAIFRVFTRLDEKTQKRALRLHASTHFKPGTPRLEAVWDTNR